MKIPITLEILSNKNKLIAILNWNDDKDKEIIKAINKGKSMFSSAQFGISETPHGKLCWALFCVDVYSKLKHKDNRLFFFDLILDLSESEYRDFVNKWFGVLYQQSELNLYLKINGISRTTPVLHQFQIKEWCNLMKKWMLYLESNSINYREATKWIYVNKLNLLKKSIAEKLIAEASIPKNKYDELILLMNHYIGDYGADQKTIKIFTLIANHFKETNKLKLPVALIDNNIIWRKLEINSSKKELTLLNIIVQTAPAYAYLLDGNRWDQIFNSTDILNTRLHELTISSLCDIPNQEAFENCNKILKEAISNREFSINQPTSIVINKQGLEEIIFYPQDKSGLVCLIKFVFSYNAVHIPNSCLVIVGVIDAKSGIIEIKGQYLGFEIEIKILTFLTAVAYRDILVARQVLNKAKYSSTSGIGFRNNLSSIKNHIRYVSRIKYDRNFGSEFANPDNISKVIKDIKPHLRQCHKRRLPTGYQASEKAKQLAQEYEYLLPEGYTFVAETRVGEEENSSLRKEFKSISLMELMFQK